MSERPLRILLNATAAVVGGGMTYWLNLLPALAEMRTRHEYLLFLPKSQHRIAPSLPSNFTVERIDFPRPQILMRLVWEQTVLPFLIRRRGIDVVLAPNDIAPMLSPRPVVIAVRNVNPYMGPPGSTFKERLRERVIKGITWASCRKADHVFFVSEDSRRVITRLLGVSQDKTSVVYHGMNRSFSERGGEAQDPARPPYVLTVSSIKLHKNFHVLIEAFARILRDPPDGRARELIIAGGVTDPAYNAQLQALCRDLGVVEAVKFVGEVAYASLPALYRGAEFFVQPSLAETFGHALVESMASGTPVVSSDLPVARELCGDAALYFPPSDSSALEACMREVIGEPELRRSRVEAGRRRAAEFSWERSARMTLDLLERVAEISTPGRSGQPSLYPPEAG
jgi:glycosyltransferase involved in cell wall biosynthesis